MFCLQFFKTIPPKIRAPEFMLLMGSDLLLLPFYLSAKDIEHANAVLKEVLSKHMYRILM